MDEFVFYRTVPLFLTYITTHTSSMNYWIITYSGLGSSVTVFPQIAIANSCRSCVEFTEQLKVSFTTYFPCLSGKSVGLEALPVLVSFQIDTFGHVISLQHWCIYVQKRMCMELNESTLDKEFETGFKSVAEEFDKIGLHW
jgi:hypothetical protein